MTAAEWDTCVSPPDMLNALRSLCYPSQFIQQLAVRILGVERMNPLIEAYAQEPPRYDCDLEYYEAQRYQEIWSGPEGMIHPMCPDPASCFATLYPIFGCSVGCAFHIDLIQVHADLIRELVGNPFAPPFVRREWLTSDVLALARGIRDEKAFDRMPILGDALMDAGGDHEAVLGHCRQSKPHHDGCWVLSFLLGATGGPAGLPGDGTP